MARGLGRQAWAEIDLGALAENVALLAGHVAPAALCAVVKAGAYGHGAVPVAKAAVAAGAGALAVAVVDEGVELREAGVEVPVLVLAEVPEGSPEVADELVRAGLLATVASHRGLQVLLQASARVGAPARVHVKIDTGMHRLGVAPESAAALFGAILREPSVRLEGVWTHLAVADGAGAEDRAFTQRQLDRFDHVVGTLAERPACLHAANTAGALTSSRARYDMVRCGIGLYGVSPLGEATPAPVDGASDGVTPAPGDGASEWASGSEVAGRLRPVLSLRARVSAVRELEGGERPSYGRLRPMPERGVVATVPLGYADGVRRALFTGGAEVLIHGRRRPMAGMVTMDQLVVDCGPDGDVGVGDEVTLIGRQGAEEVQVGEWARRSGMLSYELLTGIGPRVPRVLSGVEHARLRGAGK